MTKKNKKFSSLDQFFDDDPTDQLPTLTEHAFEPDEEDVESIEDTGETPILELSDAELAAAGEQNDSEGNDPRRLSIHRLEKEIQRLQANWMDIEDELRTRDAEIESLEDSLSARSRQIRELEADLGRATEDKRAIRDELDALRANIGQLEDRLGEKDTAIEASRENARTTAGDLEAAQAGLIRLQQELERVKEQAAEHRRLAEGHEARANEIETDNDRLSVRVQDLSLYIEGRKTRWEEQAAELTALHNAVSAKDRLLDRADYEAAASRATIDELRERVSELDRERGEQQATAEQLESDLGRQASELERLTDELETARNAGGAFETERATLSAELADAESAREQLDEALSERTAQIEELEASLAAERAALESRQQTIAETRTELEASESRHAAVLAELDAVQARCDELTAQLDGLEDKHAGDSELLESVRDDMRSLEEQNEILCKELQHKESARAELADKLESLEAEQADQSQALQASAAEIAALQEQNDMLRTELQERAMEIVEMENRSRAYDREKDDLNASLEKQKALIKNLEEELRSKLESIAEIGRNAARLPEAAEGRVERLEESAGEARDDDPDGQREADHQVTALMLTLSGDRPVKYPLYKTEMLLGRGAESDIQIRRQFISRRHAVIHTDEHGSTIEDLGSKNGIRVNARRVNRHRLQNGDIVNLGEFEFRYIDLLDSSHQNRA